MIDQRVPEEPQYIAFVYPSEAQFYEDCLGDNWRMEMFGSNILVKIIQPVPSKMNRRGFLRGMFAAVAIAIAKPLNIPTVLEPAEIPTFSIRTGLPEPVWRLLYQGIPIREVDDLAQID